MRLGERYTRSGARCPVHLRYDIDVLLFQIKDVNSNFFFQLESIVKGQGYL